MRMTPRQYARILEVMMEMYPNDLQKIAERFVFLLRRNRSAGLFAKIIREFSERVEQKNGEETVRLQTARKFSEEVQTVVEEKIRLARNTPSAKIVWSENDRLSGGVRVRIGERGYDESIARKFRSLETHMAGRE